MEAKSYRKKRYIGSPMSVADSIVHGLGDKPNIVCDCFTPAKPTELQKKHRMFMARCIMDKTRYHKMSPKQALKECSDAWNKTGYIPQL